MDIETDVLIVGAGPAGLATAISLKRRGYPGRVVVIDKGRNVGSHVLSGAVIDPAGFRDLLTDEEIAKLPVDSHVNRESFRFILGAGASLPIPWVPPMMQAKGFPMLLSWPAGCSSGTQSQSSGCAGEHAASSTWCAR